MHNTYYLMSTNPRKYEYAKKFLGSDTTVIPCTPYYNGEAVKRYDGFFNGPLFQEQEVDDYSKDYERPSQPWGKKQTIEAAKCRIHPKLIENDRIPLSDRDQYEGRNFISIENGLRETYDGVIDFVVVYVFKDLVCRDIVIGGERFAVQNLTPPIGDEHFNMTRDQQFDALLSQGRNNKS